MSPEPTFEALMDRLRRGDESAAQQIFQRFEKRLIALARSRLDPLIRQKVDPEEVMISVFESFFARQGRGQFDLDSWDSLWSLLTRITLRKCGQKVEHFRRARRDVRREAPRPDTAENSVAGWQAISREPTPSEAAMLVETLEQVLRGLGSRERAIVELSLQGYTVPEISERLGRSERTVYRLLQRVKSRLESLCGGSEPGP